MLRAALAAWAPLGDTWRLRQASGGWSAQDETAHLLRATQYGVEALVAGDAMPVERPAVVALVLRRVVLPMILAAGRFPRGGRAPAALDLAHPATRALMFETPTDALAALDRLDARVVEAFTAAVHAGGPPVTHAYFGPMPPALAWRVLSAHTLHHASALARRAAQRQLHRASGPAAP